MLTKAVRTLVSKTRRLIWRATLDPVRARQIELSAKLDQALGSTVRYGAFRGLLMPKAMFWGVADRACMLLGMYEREVQQALVNLLKTRKIFINLGAADGYYGVGAIVGGLCRKSVCYELSPVGRHVISEVANSNNVIDNVTVRGRADASFINHFSDSELRSAVVLIDIEGGEFDLLSTDVLQHLRNTPLIVELHEAFIPKGSAKADALTSLASRWFNVSELTTGDRNPNAYSELASYSDNDRWLIASEGRPYRMKWLLMEPLSRNEPESQTLACSAPQTR